MKTRFKQALFIMLNTYLLCMSTPINALQSLSTNFSNSSSLLKMEILLKRHSGRSYDATKAVKADQLRAIVEAGRLAPSSYNEQPWAFIICDHNTDPQAYEKAFSTLVEFNQGWAKNAPILIIAFAASNSAHNGQLNRWAPYDTGAAAFSMMLEATAQGLMAHQMGGFDEKKISTLFNVPSDYIPMAVMAIGYALENENEDLTKERKPANEKFFMGKWGNGIK